MTAAREKSNTNKYGWLKTILIHLVLIVLAALLFAASFPNILIKNGIPFFAWFAYIPILLVIRKNSIVSCAGWGAIYGYLAYALFNYWLGAFHPMAGTIVYGIYLFYMAAVFTLLKLAEKLYPNKYYLVQWLIWLAYEYLRTKGFLGYSYGITGYSQWRLIPLIQIASITGVWGVSALVTFPSFWLAQIILNKFTTNGTNTRELSQTTNSLKEKVRGFLCGSWLKIINLKYIKIPAKIWLAALVLSLGFGVYSAKDYSLYYPTAQIALIQHNTDPWAASRAPTQRQIIEGYRRDIAVLKRLSNEALDSYPRTQLVVWPETAFVPRIHWHTTFREDQESWLIIKELLDYLASKEVPFLIGNDDARMEPAKNPRANENHRVDYNAALLFEKGQITDVYRKLHLVPFTEHFPYKKQLPFIYNWLVNADTHFWEKGSEETVFNIGDFTFSSPICFEDTFGYLSRNFVRRGADVLINMSNDAWANSLPSQNQHLAIAVFRAVENKRYMVRSTVSGQSCIIDPAGRVIDMAEPFKETWIYASVPIIKENTLYTRFGDYLGFAFFMAALILLIFGAIWYTIKRTKKGKA
jgi:apolipoprotein N-acyltransferase